MVYVCAWWYCEFGGFLKSSLADRGLVVRVRKRERELACAGVVDWLKLHLISLQQSNISLCSTSYMNRKSSRNRHFNLVGSHISIFATYILAWAQEKVYGQLEEKQCDKVYDSGRVCGERDRKLLTASADPEECQIATEPFNNSTCRQLMGQVTLHPETTNKSVVPK